MNLYMSLQQLVGDEKKIVEYLLSYEHDHLLYKLLKTIEWFGFMAYQILLVI